jgi:hypothetical protein
MGHHANSIKLARVAGPLGHGDASLQSAPNPKLNRDRGRTFAIHPDDGHFIVACDRRDAAGACIVAVVEPNVRNDLAITQQISISDLAIVFEDG